MVSCQASSHVDTVICLSYMMRTDLLGSPHRLAPLPMPARPKQQSAPACALAHCLEASSYAHQVPMKSWWTSRHSCPAHLRTSCGKFNQTGVCLDLPSHGPWLLRAHPAFPTMPHLSWCPGPEAAAQQNHQNTVCRGRSIAGWLCFGTLAGPAPAKNNTIFWKTMRITREMEPGAGLGEHDCHHLPPPEISFMRQMCAPSTHVGWNITRGKRFYLQGKRTKPKTKQHKANQCRNCQTNGCQQRREMER